MLGDHELDPWQCSGDYPVLTGIELRVSPMSHCCWLFGLGFSWVVGGHIASGSSVIPGFVFSRSIAGVQGSICVAGHLNLQWLHQGKLLASCTTLQPRASQVNYTSALPLEQ